MKKAVHFKLHRAEGKHEECVTRIATTWKDADAILKAWARTAPANGGYHKCDFTVTWEDSETYTGRYDLKAHDANFPELLGRHVRDFLQFYTGTKKPEWMKPEAYAACMQGVTHADYIEFLNNYEIG